MNEDDPGIRISTARIELDCAQGDRLSIEAAVIGPGAAPSAGSFLRVSAAYMLGAAHAAPVAPGDACAGFAASYRGLVGDEIAALIGLHLQDRLIASRASLTGQSSDAHAQSAPQA